VTKPRVLILRGHQANPWDLRPWEEVADRFDVTVALTGSNLYPLDTVALPTARVRALSDALPPGRLRAFWAGAPFNRYLGLGSALDGADIVHAAELGTWHAAQAARRKATAGYRLVLTVWETIPFLNTYRRVVTRPNRRRAIAATDLFLAVTERARAALILEGVPPDRIVVSPPGIDLQRFSSESKNAPGEHLVVSPGRLVWEKGQQDVLRALSALRHGLAGRRYDRVRLLFVGAGREERRLRTYARELGVREAVEFLPNVPHDEMPTVYGRASCMVLASLPTPRWEEQFGMVLAEAMAASLPIVASSSGAIPEVLGASGRLFAPGDWLGLARRLSEGPLSNPPGTRVEYPRELLARYSSTAAAERLASAYARVLGAS
jgi:glycosyltransferase involved in cell wall biosynthesis